MDDKADLRQYIASEPLSPSQLADIYDRHANYGAGRWERRILGNLEALEAERDAARAELDRLHTWDGLIELLNAHYPADIFNGSSGDPGPTIVALIRVIDTLREERDRLAAAAQAGHIKWEYEDQLGDDVELTDGMYRASAVDFVRLYPYIEFQGQRWYLEASRAAEDGVTG